MSIHIKLNVSLCDHLLYISRCGSYKLHAIHLNLKKKGYYHGFVVLSVVFLCTFSFYRGLATTTCASMSPNWRQHFDYMKLCGLNWRLCGTFYHFYTIS